MEATCIHGAGAGTAGGILAVAAVLFAALAARSASVLLVGGSLLQVFVMASGTIVTVMYFLGVIFAAFWAIGIWLGYRVEQSPHTSAAANTAGRAH